MIRNYFAICSRPLTREEQDQQKSAAIDLLNRRGNEFRLAEVLPKLPSDWSLSSLCEGLMKMTKASTHLVTQYRWRQYYESKR